MQIVQTWDDNSSLYWLLCDEGGVHLVQETVGAVKNSKEKFVGPYMSKSEAIEDLPRLLSEKKKQR